MIPDAGFKCRKETDKEQENAKQLRVTCKISSVRQVLLWTFRGISLAKPRSRQWQYEQEMSKRIISSLATPLTGRSEAPAARSATINELLSQTRQAKIWEGEAELTNTWSSRLQQQDQTRWWQQVMKSAWNR